MLTLSRAIDIGTAPNPEELTTARRVDLVPVPPQRRPELFLQIDHDLGYLGEHTLDVYGTLDRDGFTLDRVMINTTHIDVLPILSFNARRDLALAAEGNAP